MNRLYSGPYNPHLLVLIAAQNCLPWSVGKAHHLLLVSGKMAKQKVSPSCLYYVYKTIYPELVNIGSEAPCSGRGYADDVFEEAQITLEGVVFADDKGCEEYIRVKGFGY